MLDCIGFRLLPRAQVKGLYKGMSAPLVGITPIFAVCFWAYDLAKKIERKVLGLSPSAELSIPQIGIAGALSAVPTTVSFVMEFGVGVVLCFSWLRAVACAGDHGPW